MRENSEEKSLACAAASEKVEAFWTFIPFLAAESWSQVKQWSVVQPWVR